MRLLILGGEPRIRLIGLVIAMSIASVVAGLSVASVYLDRSTDRWHPGAESTYRLVVAIESPSAANGATLNPLTPLEFSRAISGRIGDIRIAATVAQISVLAGRARDATAVREALYVDRAFPDLFSVGLSPGQLAAAERSRGVLLTQALATSWFGDGAPIGREITIGDGQFQVAGVIPDAASNSHLGYDLIVPLAFLPRTPELPRQTLRAYTYISAPAADPSRLERGLTADLRNYTGMSAFQVRLQPITKIAFDPPMQADRARSGAGRDLLAGASLAFAVLLGSICATGLLVTSMVNRQSPTIGILTAMGQSRLRIFLGLASELGLICAAAVPIALLVAMIFGPPIFAQLDKRLALMTFVGFTLAGVLFSLGVIMIGTSAFLWYVLKRSIANALTARMGDTHLGRAIAVGQISIQAALGCAVVLACLSVSGRIDAYLAQADRFSAIWRVSPPDPITRQLVLRNLETSSLVTEVTPSGWSPFTSRRANYPVFAGSSATAASPRARMLAAAANAPRLLGAELLAGRWLTPQEDWTDRCRAVVNRALVSSLFQKPPAEAVGSSFTIATEHGLVRCSVTGVIEDVGFEPASVAVEPEVHVIDRTEERTLLFRTADPSQSAAELREVIGRNAPGQTGLPQRMFDVVRTAYDHEFRLRRFFLIASVVIFGLMTYTLVSAISLTIGTRRLELGVRRAFGATSVMVARIVMRDALIGVACGLVVGLAAFVLFTRRADEFALEGGATTVTLAVLATMAPVFVALLANWRTLAKVAPNELLRAQ